jgi:hypothetical protein
MKIQITNTSYFEGHKDEGSILKFIGESFETLDGGVINFKDEENNVGKTTLKYSNGRLEIENDYNGTHAFYHFVENEESAATYITEEGRSLNLKIYTKKIVKKENYLLIEYDVLAFNGIPGIVHYEYLLEETNGKC